MNKIFKKMIIIFNECTTLVCNLQRAFKGKGNENNLENKN